MYKITCTNSYSGRHISVSAQWWQRHTGYN